MKRKVRVRIPYRRIKSLKVYLKRNLGSPFILLSMGLLSIAMVQALIGLEAMAETLAVYAYLLLAGGVILQLISWLKGNDTNGEKPG